MTARIGDVGISVSFVPWGGLSSHLCGQQRARLLPFCPQCLRPRPGRGAAFLPAAAGSGLPHGSYGGSSAEVPRLFCRLAPPWERSKSVGALLPPPPVIPAALPRITQRCS